MPHPRQLIVLILLAATFLVARMDGAWRALWPSLVALASVLALRSALSGLLIGAATGALILAEGHPLTAFAGFFKQHLIPALQSPWNLSVLIFTLLLGGFAALLERGRGFEAILARLISSDRGPGSARRVQWSAMAMGLLCFFDGLASSLLTGKALRPLADRAGVSRARLAYLVDSTSSAVACVAVMSTWIAYQLSMIREGYAQAGIEEVRPFQIFLASVPLNFYCWFTLFLLAVVIARDWNIGPMAEAEIKVIDPEQAAAQDPTPPSATGVVLPLLALLGGLIIGLYWNGAQGGFFPITFRKAIDAFGNAAAADVLVYSSVLACGAAFAANYRAIVRTERPAAVFLDGVQRFFIPCLILIAAWCLSSTLKQLEASKVLAGLLGRDFTPGLFPMAVFALGVLISFTTGTSWGTMGVLMPLALPVALQLDPAIVPGTVAAVFSGAVFGDHCSPLSDTTIVSSLACDLDPIEHVRTQLPYALIAAALACLAGFIPSGFGLPAPICLLAGFALMAGLPGLLQPAPRSDSSDG